MKGIWSSGIGTMVLCAILFALSALCVKLLHKQIPVFEIIAVRSLTCSVLTIISIARMHNGGKLVHYVGKRENFWLLGMRGVAGALSFTLYYFSIDILPLPDAVVIFFMNTVITALMSVVGRYEKGTWQMGVGCTACIIGVCVLVHPSFLFGGETHGDVKMRLIGVGLGLSASIFSSFAFMSIKALGNNEEPIVMTLWFHAVAGVSAAVPLCFGWPDPYALPDLRQAGLLAGVVFTSFFAQLLISRGFQLLSASLAAAINLTQVIHANILGILVLHDNVHWYSYAGAACIVAGVLITQEGRLAVQKEEEAAEDDSPQSLLEHGPAPPSATTNAALLPGARSGGASRKSHSAGASYSMEQ